MAGFYPPVNFHFKVEFDGFGRTTDSFFQSVSGLDVAVSMTTRREAGANGYVHYVPQHVQYTDLVLKRGVFRPRESDITDWFNQAVRDFRFSPKNILVSLLDEQHEPLMVWKVFHALPKSWKMQDMNAEQGAVFIETMTLAYSYFTFSKG